MPNIDRFDKYVALILSRLYEQFPVKTDIDVRKLTEISDTDDFGALLAPDGKESRDARIAYATAEWLIDTGYVRAKEPHYPIGFRACVLTAEGLKLLKATPASVHLTETVGDKLVRFVKEGALDLAQDLVKSALAL